jgi:hypothetical protein
MNVKKASLSGAILDSWDSSVAFWDPNNLPRNFQHSLYFYTKVWYSIDRIIFSGGLPDDEATILWLVAWPTGPCGRVRDE